MSFYVMSGIDGCGKSTQIELLSQWLVKSGFFVEITKAYDDDAKIILDTYTTDWKNQNAIMFLFQALHAKQYTDTINALEKGHVVLADRWDETYLAYHSNFGELSLDHDLFIAINKLAYKELLPELGFIFTVPSGIARNRRALRGRVGKFENHPDEYFETMQATYIRIAEERGWSIIDGTMPPDLIHEKVKKIVLNYL